MVNPRDCPGRRLLWRRQTWGYIVAGAVLTLWVLESIGVAVDQWFGHNADPTSAVASGTMVWVFAGLAAVGCVPLAIFFRNVANECLAWQPQPG